MEKIPKLKFLVKVQEKTIPHTLDSKTKSLPPSSLPPMESPRHSLKPRLIILQTSHDDEGSRVCKKNKKVIHFIISKCPNRGIKEVNNWALYFELNYIKNGIINFHHLYRSRIRQQTIVRRCIEVEIIVSETECSTIRRSMCEKKKKIKIIIWFGLESRAITYSIFLENKTYFQKYNVL